MADIYLAIIACRLTGAGAVSRRVRGRDRGRGTARRARAGELRRRRYASCRTA